jgi:hypothetical protein
MAITKRQIMKQEVIKHFESRGFFPIVKKTNATAPSRTAKPKSVAIIAVLGLLMQQLLVF